MKWAGSVTADSVRQVTGWQGAPLREKTKAGFFLKSCFLFWRGEECREVACVCLHPEAPENTLDVLLDLPILFPCQCWCLVDAGGLVRLPRWLWGRG